jgi:hypothetical protein
MKRAPDMIEGPEAWTRFETAMKTVITVPHSEIKRRIEERRTRSAANPNRRGPKPKVSSHGPAVSPQS